MFSYEYPRPAVTADIIVLSVLHPREVLLIKRKNDPYKDCWALPGGFMDINETTLQCAKRELKEETNYDCKEDDLFLLSIADKVDRDPRGRTISAVYLLEDWHSKEELQNLVAGDDASELKWFKVSSIMKKEVPLAFDHFELIEKAYSHYLLSYSY